MSYKFNPFSGTFDKVRKLSKLDDRYVNVSGDTMTGDLTLPALEATSAGESEFYGGVIIKAGEKLYFDGA